MSTERPTVSSAAPGTVVTPGAIAFERLLPGPIERVWDYLTVPELRRTWLADGPMALTRGGRAEFWFDNQTLNEHAEPVPEKHLPHAAHARDTGFITACDPPRLLAFTWDDPGGSTEVRFELEPSGDMVLLRLTHARLDNLDSAVSVASGWHTHLDFLKARLAGTPAPMFWTVHGSLESDYERTLSKAPEGYGRPGAGKLFALPDLRRRVVFERVYDLPLADLWQAACQPPGMDAWYPAKLRHSGEVGGWVTQTFESQDGAPDETLEGGTLTAYDPPRILEFEQAPIPGSRWTDTHHPQRLRIELSPVDEGNEGRPPTRLTLTHEFRGDETAARVMPGWHTCLDYLSVALGVGEAPDPTLTEARREWYGRWVSGRS